MYSGIFLYCTCNITNAKRFLLHTSGISKDGKEVFLRDIWPTREELQVSVAYNILFPQCKVSSNISGTLLLVHVVVSFY